jgi:hypothetical protein
MRTMNANLCPVCGYDLGFPAWRGNAASHEYCPSCGIQFGYHDDSEDNCEEARQKIYEDWRNRWVAQGMKWSIQELRTPEGWNPVEQLRLIGVYV